MSIREQGDEDIDIDRIEDIIEGEAEPEEPEQITPSEDIDPVDQDDDRDTTRDRDRDDEPTTPLTEPTDDPSLDQPDFDDEPTSPTTEPTDDPTRDIADPDIIEEIREGEREPAEPEQELILDERRVDETQLSQEQRREVEQVRGEIASETEGIEESDLLLREAEDGSGLVLETRRRSRFAPALATQFTPPSEMAESFPQPEVTPGGPAETGSFVQPDEFVEGGGRQFVGEDVAPQTQLFSDEQVQDMFMGPSRDANGEPLSQEQFRDLGMGAQLRTERQLEQAGIEDFPIRQLTGVAGGGATAFETDFTFPSEAEQEALGQIERQGFLTPRLPGTTDSPEAEAAREAVGGGVDLLFGGGAAESIRGGLGLEPTDQTEITGPEVGVEPGPFGIGVPSLSGFGQEGDVQQQGQIIQSLTEGGIFDEETEQALFTRAVERQEQFGLEAEAESFAGRFTEREGAIQFAGGLGQVPGEAAALPATGGIVLQRGSQLATNIPGTAGEFGAVQTGAAITETGARMGAGVVEQAQQNPFGFGGQLAGELALGFAAGRAIESGATRARNIRQRQRGEVVEFEEVTSQPVVRGERTLPEFETPPGAPTGQAVREVQRRAADQPESLQRITGEESLLLRSEAEALPSGFTAEAGQFELPGLFASPDLSPLRLQEAQRSFGLGSLRPRLPRVRGQGDQVTVFPGERIQTMPESATGAGFAFTEAGERIPDPTTPGARFLEEGAERGTAFVRPTGSRTRELEAIFPPGSQFQEVGEFGVRMPGGRIVPGAAFRRAGEQAVDRPGDVEGFVNAFDVPETRISQPEPGQPITPTVFPGATPGVTSSVPPSPTSPTGATSPFGQIGQVEQVSPTRQTEPTQTIESTFDIPESSQPVSMGGSEMFMGPSSPVSPTEPSRPTAPSGPTSTIDSIFPGVSSGAPSTPSQPVSPSPTSPTGPTSVSESVFGGMGTGITSVPGSPQSGLFTGPTSSPTGTITSPGFTPPASPGLFGFAPEPDPTDEREQRQPTPFGEEFFNPLQTGAQALQLGFSGFEPQDQEERQDVFRSLFFG